MADTTGAARVPRVAGELVTIMRGEVCALGVSPKDYGGEQKRDRDGRPLWVVDIAWRPAGGGRPEVVRATYAGEEPPKLPQGWTKQALALQASYYDFTGEDGRAHRGWSYALDERGAAQWTATARA